MLKRTPFLLLLLLCACAKLPEPPLVPEIKDVAAEDVGAGAAMLTARLEGTEKISSCGFVVMLVGSEPATQTASTGEMLLSASISENRMSAVASGLTPDTEYSFHAWADNGNGFRISSVDVTFRTLAVPQEQPIPVPDGIPDDNFRAWLLWHYDADKDGTISENEAAAVMSIELSSENISSIEGVALFPNLDHLHAAGLPERHGQLTEADLRSNCRLSSIYLAHNHISSLLLPVSGESLYRLEIPYNELSSIDLRPYSALDLVALSYNKFTHLDFSGLDLLDELHVDHNPLTTLALGNARLRYLDCSGTHLTTLDLSRCPHINVVDCSDCTALKTIYLAKGQVLGSLSCPENVNIIHYD